MAIDFKGGFFVSVFLQIKHYAFHPKVSKIKNLSAVLGMVRQINPACQFIIRHLAEPCYAKVILGTDVSPLTLVNFL